MAAPPATRQPARAGVLVVEDESFQGWSLETAARQLGARAVFRAGDGADALEMLAAHGESIDVVVTDLDMPRMDGLELIRRMGEAGNPRPVVVCSALDRTLIATVERMAQAYRVPLLGTVQKPMPRGMLAEILGRQAAAPAAAAPSRIPFSAAELEHALREGQFEAFFQPKVELATGRVVGAEALARWRHPYRGTVAPDHFIGALEAAGLIGRLGEGVFEHAIAACARWRAAGLDATVSVNVSLLGFEGLAERLQELTGRHAIEPRHVVVEVTESARAPNPARALETLSRLRMRGFGLAIDDYGTGYSSLQQLAHIAFSELKIDRSLVRNAPAGQSARVLLESTLQLARRLGILAVAEGVETRAEWDLLRELGCEAAQGYFVAAPMPVEDFLEWCRR